MQSPLTIATLNAAFAQQEQPASETGSSDEELTNEILDLATESIVSTLQTILESFAGHLPLIVAGLVILVLTALVTRIVHFVSARLLNRTRLRGSLKQLIQRLVSIGSWSLGIVLASMVVFPGLTPTRALAGLGLGSVAIGFAFKDIFENFFAGILILWRFPFEDGDFIECESLMGMVEGVTIRNTLIRTLSGELVVIPNSTIFKNPVHVLTGWNARRMTIHTGVAYGENADECQQVIENATNSCETVNSEYPVEVFAQEFADSSISFEVSWWTGPTPLDQRRSRDEVVRAIKRELDRAGIEIPFPYRTLTFKHPLSVEDNRGGADAPGH